MRMRTGRWRQAGRNTVKWVSPPCYAGEADADIDPRYLSVQDRMPIQISAANTILYCAHWQATERFYRHALGFEESFSREDWFVEFRIGEGCHLSIADEAKCTVKAARGAGITLSFKVEALAEVHRYCTEQGLEPSPIRSHSWRAPYFFIYDPEGNRIELWTDAAVV
jgi:catechol 2,3-dioxygenase-like lactoylglutathione lyase family enzyme